MFLSISARLLVNVEALNMVESVGNVVRHRRAPIIVPSQDKNEYVLVYTPVISGENLANAYQRWLAQLAKQESLPCVVIVKKLSSLNMETLRFLVSMLGNKN